VGAYLDHRRRVEERHAAHRGAGIHGHGPAVVVRRRYTPRVCRQADADESATTDPTSTSPTWRPDAREITTNPGSDDQPQWSPTARASRSFRRCDGTGDRRRDDSGDGRHARLMLYDVATQGIKARRVPTSTSIRAHRSGAPRHSRLVHCGRRTSPRHCVHVKSGAYTQLTQKKTMQARLAQPRRARRRVTMDTPSTRARSRDRSRLRIVQAADDDQSQRRRSRWERPRSSPGRARRHGDRGVLLKPSVTRSGKKYPMLRAHGDRGRLPRQLSRGGLRRSGVGRRRLVVFYPNPRGSANYGERFVRPISTTGAAATTRHHDGRRCDSSGVASPTRQARAHRVSYGGYMTRGSSRRRRFKAPMVGPGRPLASIERDTGLRDDPRCHVAAVAPPDVQRACRGRPMPRATSASTPS